MSPFSLDGRNKVLPARLSPRAAPFVTDCQLLYFLIFLRIDPLWIAKWPVLSLLSLQLRTVVCLYGGMDS
jgi:hypothetical protein